MKKFLTILLLLATMFPFAAKADQLTVCDGANTNGYVPVYGYYADAYLRAQMVYPASMLADMNGTTISGMKFYATQSSVNWGATFQVYMAEYPSTTISSFINPTTATTVYTGTLAIAGGEMVVTLDQQFNYAGGNLLIGFDETTTGSYITSTWKGQTTTGAAVQGNSYSSLSAVTANQRNFLPKVTFDYYVPSFEVTPTDLGVRPNGAWMEPLTVEVGGGVYNVAGMEIDNDYFTFDGPTAPFTTPASFTVTTGNAGAEGSVEGTLSFMYNNGKALKQFTMTATAYDPTAGDVVETATVVSNPVNYTNTPTGIYHNYNLPGEASDGADAVYKLTFANDVMLDANVGDAEGGKVALYPEGFNGEGGPMATNNYEYTGPQIDPGFGDNASFDFEDGFQGWTSLDADGDGYGWKQASTMLSSGLGHNGSADFVFSQSYDNNSGVLYPNNYLVSPQQYVIGGSSVFTIWACGQDANYSAEHFSIEVSEAGASASDFVKVAEWTIGQRTAKGNDKVRGGSRDQSTWKQYTADLSAYAGKSVWIAIRHFNCSDEFYLDVDDVELSTGSKGVARGGRSTLTYNFDDGTLQNWTNIDADGDGYGWFASSDFGANSTSYAAVSESYRGALTPDNYLVSPQLTLGTGASISFYEASYYGYEEPLHLMVSTTGTNPSDFTSIQSWSFYNSGFAQQTVDLSAYAGQQVYLAFRHYGSTDQYKILIDDITIDLGGSAPEPGAGMYVPAGTYYLVAQATEPFTTHINATAAPAPEQVVYINPTDGMTGVEIPSAASWKLGDYTTEMQVVLGSQFPPQDVLIDWTSSLVESVMLNNLLPNTTYFMQVNERNGSGMTMGEVIGFTTAFEKPVVEVATPYLYPGDAAMLSWEIERSFRGYNVYADGVRVNEELIVEDEYAVEGLAYGPHTLNVTAVYDEGESAYSNDINVNMTGYGHVAGTVFEQDGTTPIEGAAVKFIGTDAFGFDQTFTFTTAANGTFAGDIYEGSYDSQAELEGYQVTPGNHVNMAYDQTVSGLVYNMTEEYLALGQVNSEVTADNKANVWWSWAPATVIVDFEEGELPEGWNQVGSYGWEITTNAPYEGTYCMKSSNAGIASSTGAIEVTVDVPYDAKMSFYVKPSSESNYDKFFFYIDGVEKFNTSGAGSWTKKEYSVTAGTHTYKWAYTKDSSVNSNDDCIYVDYVTLFEKTEPTPPVVGGTTYNFENGMEGWTSLDADGDGYGWIQASTLVSGVAGHEGSADFVLSQSYDNNFGVLYPDNYLVSPTKLACQAGAQVKLWACGQDANYAAEHFGVAVSTGGATASEFTTVAEWTIGSKGGTRDMAPGNRAAVRGTRDQSEWIEYTANLSAYAGQEVWVAIRHFNVSDMFYIDVDDITLATGGSKMETAGNRSFASYNVYRKNVLADEYSKITSTADTTYVDAQWSTLPASVYQYGVSATYAGNRDDGESEIVWADPMDNNMEATVEVSAVTNNGQSAAGTVVRFENNIEEVSYEATLDETGFVSFEGFRKGYYTMSVELPGYAANMGGEVEIFQDKTYNVTLTEIVAPAEGLFASATGWVMWDNIGGDIPTPPTPGEDTEFTEGFEGGLNGWNVLDVNTGEGTWVHSDDNLQGQIYTAQAHTGTGFALCYSFVDYVGAVNTDSYMYTPQKYGIVNGSTLSFWADNANDSYPENFSVCVATADNPQDADFIEVWSGGAKGGNAEKAAVRHSENRFDNWRHHTIDLSAYAGQQVYIAFHDVNYDMYEIWIDDVELTAGSKDRAAQYSIVMLDGVVAGQATGNWFQLDTDNLVEGQEYEVSVASVYTTGMSEWMTTTFTYWSCENFKPGVKNLAGEVQGVNDVKLTWTLPGGGGSGDEFSFAFDNDLEGWTNIDGDGDGHVFYHSNEASNHGTMAVTSHSGAGHVMGESYCNATYAALTPNDFFVTPQQYNIGSSSMLSFWACTQDENYAAEHFGVAISTNGNTSASDFTTIAEWTLTAKTTGFKGPRATDGSREGAWYQYTCDLSEYAGQAAWIAIRHFNCSDQFIMCLDDVAMNNADGKQGNNRAMWDYVASFSCTSAGQQAVATDGEYIYTASWQATPTGGYTFYKYDLEGTFVEGFDISGATGIRDLTFDGEYFYGTSGASQLFILDLANKTMVGTVNCSGATSRHCSYDPVRDGFWVGNWSDLALYSRSGSLIQSAPSPSSAYGSGYFQEEDGTEHLYLFCQPNSDALVYDYNITTNQITGPVMDFSQTPSFNAGISGGSFIGQYNGKICWFGNAQQDPNLVGIYELAEGQPVIEGDFLGAMIFRDGELITPAPVMANQMVDANVAEGEHEYMARLAFGNAEYGVLDTMWYAMSCPVFATVNVEVECTPVSELDATEVDNADGTYGVNLEWICTGADIQGYKVYRNNSYIGMTTTMSYYDDRTNNPGNYTYGVVAVYDYCESDMVTTTVSVDAVGENEVIEGIYPNPTKGILNINATAMQQITVVNALGQVVINVEVSGDQTTIDMSGFEAGVYMVTVTTENGSSVKRISVIK